MLAASAPFDSVMLTSSVGIGTLIKLDVTSEGAREGTFDRNSVEGDKDKPSTCGRLEGDWLSTTGVAVGAVMFPVEEVFVGCADS